MTSSESFNVLAIAPAPFNLAENTYERIVFTGLGTAGSRPITLSGDSFDLSVRRCKFYQCIGSNYGGAIQASCKNVILSESCAFECAATSSGQTYYIYTNEKTEFDRNLIAFSGIDGSYSSSTIDIRGNSFNMINTNITHSNIRGTVGSYYCKVDGEVLVSFCNIERNKDTEGASIDYHGQASIQDVISCNVLNCTSQPISLIWTDHGSKNLKFYDCNFFDNSFTTFVTTGSKTGAMHARFYSCMFSFALTQSSLMDSSCTFSVEDYVTHTISAINEIVCSNIDTTPDFTSPITISRLALPAVLAAYSMLFTF